MEIIWIILGVLSLLTILWLLAIGGKRGQTDFIGLTGWHYAHRGLHNSKKRIPENSIAAFLLAVEHGYGAELDVRLSKDGKLIVMHDESLMRTTGADKNISDCTLEELKFLRLEGTQERIPLLEDVLPLFEGKSPLVIELKTYRRNHVSLTQAVCELLDQYPRLKYCIESFDPRVLLWLKRNRPEVIRGQLALNFIHDRSGLSAGAAWFLTNLLCNFLTHPHFIAYRFQDRKNLSLRLCKKLWGIQEFSWTIRNKEDAKTALDDGAAIIFEGFCP